MSEKKISYLDRTFDDYRASLLNYVKNLDNIDFIISTIPLNHNSIPVILVNLALLNIDFLTII